MQPLQLNSNVVQFVIDEFIIVTIFAVVVVVGYSSSSSTFASAVAAAVAIYSSAELAKCRIFGSCCADSNTAVAAPKRIAAAIPRETVVGEYYVGFPKEATVSTIVAESTGSAPVAAHHLVARRPRQPHQPTLPHQKVPREERFGFQSERQQSEVAESCACDCLNY